jgi:hypothetical protein
LEGESFVSAPTVVARGPGYRVIESVSLGLKDGFEVLSTNRYTIRGELVGEEVLPGVRTSVLKPATVFERGDGYKKVETITEFLNFDGSTIVETNRFVEVESETDRICRMVRQP